MPTPHLPPPPPPLSPYVAPRRTAPLQLVVLLAHPGAQQVLLYMLLYCGASPQEALHNYSFKRHLFIVQIPVMKSASIPHNLTSTVHCYYESDSCQNEWSCHWGNQGWWWWHPVHGLVAMFLWNYATLHKLLIKAFSSSSVDLTVSISKKTKLFVVFV